MKRLPILFLVLLIHAVAAPPSSAQFCVDTDEWRTQFKAIRNAPHEGSFKEFIEEKHKAEIRLIESNDAELARNYLDKFGNIIGQRIRDNVTYFISATERHHKKYTDINKAINAINELLPNIYYTGCEKGVFTTLVDLRIVLAAAAETALSYEKCEEASEYFGESEELIRNALVTPDFSLGDRTLEPDAFKKLIKGSIAKMETAMTSIRGCREERNQAMNDARRRAAETRAMEEAEAYRLRQQAIRQQAHDQEMARLRAQAQSAQPTTSYGWVPQQNLPTVSSGESFPSTPQPSLSDVFRGSSSTPYNNPYAPGGR